MGILEAIVVVYLRRIYYPGGFGFPLVPLEPGILRAEIVREAMTLVMLAACAFLAGRNTWGRLMAFLVLFGAWDLAYYAGLKLFLDWPASLLTPDILFLIPKVWVGPVLAPVLVAATWVVAGLWLHEARPSEIGLGLRAVAALAVGASLILASFLIPVGTPERPGFHWAVFGAGYALGAMVLVICAQRSRRTKRRRFASA
jgi:hypothetical protein